MLNDFIITNKTLVKRAKLLSVDNILYAAHIEQIFNYRYYSFISYISHYSMFHTSYTFSHFVSFSITEISANNVMICIKLCWMPIFFPLSAHRTRYHSSSSKLFQFVFFFSDLPLTQFKIEVRGLQTVQAIKIIFFSKKRKEKKESI